MYILDDYKLLSKNIKVQISLYNNLEDEQAKESIIMSLVLNLNSLNEGIINAIISNQIERNCGNNDFAKRLVAQFANELLSDTWNKYKMKIQILLDKKLSEISEPETLKSIEFLYRIRNQIAHGNTRLYQTKEGIDELQFKYMPIQKYLMNNSLIEDDALKYKIFTGEVFNHFLFSSKSFFQQINNVIEEPRHGYIKRNIISSLDSIKAIQK